MEFSQRHVNGREKAMRIVTTHLESGAHAHEARCEQFAEVLRQDGAEIEDETPARKVWCHAWVAAGRDKSHKYTWETLRPDKLCTEVVGKT